MTWRKWWALEVLMFMVLVYAMAPLSIWRQAAVMALAGALSVFYHQRITGQKADKR